MTNADCWLEVEALDTSGHPVSSITSDHRSDVETSATDHPDSSETWTGTSGFTTERKQYLTVDVTPQEVGFLQARVFLAKPSATLYVDPVLTIT
jgi:hypothetical protein